MPKNCHSTFFTPGISRSSAATAQEIRTFAAASTAGGPSGHDSPKYSSMPFAMPLTIFA